MTTEEKAKAYDEAIIRMKAWVHEHPDTQKEAEFVFPELRGSEDERIKKCIIDTLKNYHHLISTGGVTKEEMLAWIEKQGSEPNWCHHKVDLSNCSEEYCKAYYDGWNNCNMQHSQCKSELDDVIKCLINGMKFYYEDNEEATWGTDKWSMPVKHIIKVLEKQGDKDKLIQELGEYKVKYTQEVLEKHLKTINKDNERLRKTTIAFLKDFAEQGYENAVECIDWLKSLRLLSQWRPSDEQIYELTKAIDYYTSHGFPNKILDELLKQLKNL